MMQPMFCLRILQEKFREFNKILLLVFVDLEKAYGTVPRDIIWKKLVPKANICIIQVMYEECKTGISSCNDRAFVTELRYFLFVDCG